MTQLGFFGSIGIIGVMVAAGMAIGWSLWVIVLIASLTSLMMSIQDV